VSRLRVHKRLAGDRAGTTDTNSPKKYPIPYDVMLGDKRCGQKEEGEDIQSDGACLPK